MKRTLEKPIVKSLIVNGLILIILFFFYEPTAKNDEFEMGKYLIGAVDGMPGFSLWMSPVFDYIVRFCMALTSRPEAFYVIEYVLVFISFVTIIVVMFSVTENDKLQMFVLLPFMLLGYEFYIRLTFTKTSGILAISGYILILYYIEYGTKIRNYFLAIMMIFFSVIIRPQIVLMVTFLFWSAFIIFILEKNKKEQMFKKIMQFVISVVLVLGIFKVNQVVTAEVYKTNQDWQICNKYNQERAMLYDYGWPTYKEYRSEYARLGISKNDYILWHDYHILSDTNILTSSLRKELYAVGNRKDDEDYLRKVLNKAIKSIPNYLMGEPLFFAFVFVFIVGSLFSSCGKKYYCNTAIIFFLALMSYIVLFIRGRTMHHVDCVIFSCASILLMYYVSKGRTVQYNSIKHELTAAIILLIVIVIHSFSGWMGTIFVGGSSYARILWSDYEGQKKDYQEYELISGDKQHLYAYIYQDLIPSHVFPIKKNFLQNMYRTDFTDGIPAYIHQLKNYGVDGVDSFWRDMINNDVIYFKFTSDSKELLPYIVTYLQEHYSSSVGAYLVKDIENSYVYCFRDTELQISNQDILNGENECEYYADMEASSDIRISGYAFLPGEDSFSDLIIVEDINHITGEVKYQYATKTENKMMNCDDKYQGLYGGFTANISLEDGDDICNHTYNMILLSKTHITECR